ncbi:MAG: dipeptide epimerase [Bacteroidota bacterium]
MKLIIHTFDLELKHQFAISRRSFDRQKTLIVELQLNGQSGYGEATTNPYYHTTIPNMVAALERIRPLIEGYSFDEPEAFWANFHPHLQDQPFVLCALDVAAWDLYGRQRGQPLHRLWGLDSSRLIKTCYTLGIADLATSVARMQAMPWPIYKLKLGTANDLQLVERLRQHSDARFRVDVNCAWTAAQTLAYAPRLKALGVEFIEQPLPDDQWEAMEQLYQQSPLPIIADESCKTFEDIEHCVGRFHGINIKLMKCGGLTPARKMIKKAKALGLKVMLGCMTESSVGISAIAQLLPLLDYVDMDGPLFLKKDIASGVQIKASGIVLSELPGTGVQLHISSKDHLS